MTLPPVSVVIPNYNHARYLPACLDAVLGQSVPPAEVLVLDDASTDDSVAVLEGYARRSPLVKVVRNEKNLGVVANMNRGLQMASCEHACFLAADDEVLPGLFEHLLGALAAHPQAGFASGLSEWRCHATGLKWIHGSRMPETAGYLAPKDLIGLARSGRLAMSGQHAVYHRGALMKAGGWRPELRWYTDWFGAWVVGFRQGACHVPRVLSVFNLHPTSYYHSAKSQQERRETMDRILCLLESEAYGDVAPAIRESGLLGGFGWPMMRVMVGRRRHLGFVNGAFLKQLAKRMAETTGRRVLPRGLAEVCLRWFYRRRGGVGQ